MPQNQLNSPQNSTTITENPSGMTTPTINTTVTQAHGNAQGQNQAESTDTQALAPQTIELIALRACLVQLEANNPPQANATVEGRPHLHQCFMWIRSKLA